MIVNRIARTFRLNARSAFGRDSTQVVRLATVNNPMVVEKRPGPGDQVRVREGVFRDVEGTVLERAHESRLVVAVHLVQQGVTLEIDEQSLDVIG
jgi:transcription antitermination factor NusG